MPSEPNQSIDQQLKAYAEQRRQEAGEPFAMPPTTRRILQAEVDRRAATLGASTVARPGWWQLFWPYVALGTSATAALAVCLWIWRADQQTEAGRMELAKADQKGMPLVSTERARTAPTEEKGEELKKDVDAFVATPSLLRKAGEAEALAVVPALDSAAIKPTQGAAANLAYGAEKAQTQAPSVQLMADKPSAAAAPSASPDAAGGATRIDLAERDARANAPIAPTPRPTDTLARQAVARPDTLALGRKDEAAEGKAKTLARPDPPQEPRPTGPAPVLAEVREAAPVQGQARFADTTRSYGRALTAESIEAKQAELAASGANKAQASPGPVPAPAQRPEVLSETVTVAAARGLPVANNEVRFALQEASALVAANSRNLGVPNQAVAGPQRFQQAGATPALRRNFNSPPRVLILNDFRLEQRNDSVQIIDADGSVYEGPIRQSTVAATPTLGDVPALGARFRVPAKTEFSEARPQARPGPAAAAGRFSGQPASSPPPASAAAPDQAPRALEEGQVINQVSFRAVGTNRSSNQRVVFDGRLVINNALAPLAVQNQDRAGAAGNTVAPSPLNNAVVQGRAVIGGRTQVEINATPAAQ